MSPKYDLPPDEPRKLPPSSYGDLPDDDWRTRIASSPWFDEPEPTRAERLKEGLRAAVETATDFVRSHLPGRPDSRRGKQSPQDDFDLDDVPWRRRLPESTYGLPDDDIGDTWLSARSFFDEDWPVSTEPQTPWGRIREQVSGSFWSVWDTVRRHRRAATAVVALTGIVITGAKPVIELVTNSDGTELGTPAPPTTNADQDPGVLVTTGVIGMPEEEDGHQNTSILLWIATHYLQLALNRCNLQKTKGRQLGWET